MNQNKFINIAIILGIVVITGITGYFVLNQKTTTSPIPPASTSTTPTPTPPTNSDSNTTITVLLGQEFTLKKGENARVKGLNVFLKVKNLIDATCPKGAQCIWGGFAVVYELTVDGKVYDTLMGNPPPEVPYDVFVKNTDYKTYATFVINTPQVSCTSQSGIFQDECWRGLAKRFSDQNYCSKIKSLRTKDACFEDLAEQLSNGAFAPKVIGEIKKDSLDSNVLKIFSISGSIDFGNDTGKLLPVFSYNSLVLNDSKGGEYSLELLDQDDSVLFKQDFQPAKTVSKNDAQNQSFYTKILSFFCKINLLNRFNITCPYDDSALGTGGFVFKLPYIDGTTTIRLKHGSKTLDQLQSGASFPSVKINPIATRQLPTTGKFKFSWSASDIDGDTLHYLVLVSDDSQKTWKTISSGLYYPELSYDVSVMKKSENIYFQVLASDGINTTSDTVGPFSASIKMPTALIINPKDGDSIQQGYPITLLGSGNSPEEENTIPDERLTWSSDISGILGNGQTLQVEKLLPKGKHGITLSVIDKYGNKGSASINLMIK